MMNRRTFLRATAMTATGVAVAPLAQAAEGVSGKVMTVLGPIDPAALGLTLSHEHAVVDFIGAEKADAPRHDAGEAFATVLPHLKALKERGCRGFVECTPNYIGRDVQLLKRLATASGLHILTNTGYYGAAAISSCQNTPSRKRPTS